ncbi:MAG: hypothetical protein GXY36_01755 [Chloroflexi bacterium]|nr:hypothetical protein [Chloroflexota bacterium]
MQRYLAFIAAAMCLLFVVPVSAQDSTLIEYGQTVTGEITNQFFEVPYSFTGQQGDVIVIEMQRVDIFGDFTSPALILLDEAYNMLGTGQGYDKVVLITVLPADATYNILATRQDGRAGTSVGEYSLRLLKLQPLSFDQPVRAALSNKETNYFMIEGLNSFDLVYKKLSGDFNPEVSLHILGDNEMLEQVGSLYGPYIASGTLGINDRSLSNHLYLVIVREQTYSYSFDEVTADYTLTLVEP